MYKVMFMTCMKEKFGRLYFIYYIVPGFISFFLDEVLSFGILSVMMLFTAAQISKMFSLSEMNCINNGYYDFRIHKAKNIFTIALSANIPWLLFMIVKSIIIPSQVTLFIMIIWIYLSVLGAVLGMYIKSEVIYYGIILLLFFVCLQKTLIHELYFRYLSPVMLLRGEVNLFSQHICLNLIGKYV